MTHSNFHDNNLEFHQLLLVILLVLMFNYAEIHYEKQKSSFLVLHFHKDVKIWHSKSFH